MIFFFLKKSLEKENILKTDVWYYFHNHMVLLPENSMPHLKYFFICPLWRLALFLNLLNKDIWVGLELTH